LFGSYTSQFIAPPEDLEDLDAFELAVLADAELDCDEPEDVASVEAEPEIPVVPVVVVPEPGPVLAVAEEALTPEPVVVLPVFRVLLQFTNTMARGKTK